jgi:hypothetical protein
MQSREPDGQRLLDCLCRRRWLRSALRCGGGAPSAIGWAHSVGGSLGTGEEKTSDSDEVYARMPPVSDVSMKPLGNQLCFSCDALPPQPLLPPPPLVVFLSYTTQPRMWINFPCVRSLRPVVPSEPATRPSTLKLDGGLHVSIAGLRRYKWDDCNLGPTAYGCAYTQRTYTFRGSPVMCSPKATCCHTIGRLLAAAAGKSNSTAKKLCGVQ